MNKINYTIEEVNIVLHNLGYELVDDKFIGIDKKINIKDSTGYFYSKALRHLELNYGSYKFGKSNPHTIQNIKLWCKINNKSFELVSEIFQESNKNLKWKCLKEDCGEVFESTWSNTYKGNNCPYCSGHRVCLSNCLATNNPNLASEWHPTKNGDLTPYSVTTWSGKEVWWQCSKNPKHEWSSAVSERSVGNGCPYCSGRIPSEDYNLFIHNPKLCEEWDYKKNDKKPEEYTPTANKKVWWICKECKHEWYASIINRNSRNIGCPECSKSKGEKRILEYLNLKSIVNTPQKKFEGLTGLGNGNLSYDFYLPDFNLLVEYQGEQHERPVDFNGKGIKYAKKKFKTQQEHDKRKKEYAIINKIILLEIWYLDFDKIEEILSKELNL